MDSRLIVKAPQSKSLKSARVTLAPGADVGVHVTERREELLIVLMGTATLIKGGERISLRQGESHFIPEGVKHNIMNESREPLEYVYVVALFG